MQFQMELIVYTQDTTYNQMLAKRKREDEKEAVNSLVNNNSSGATLKEMLKHLKSYYQVNVTETLFFMFAFKNMI